MINNAETSTFNISKNLNSDKGSLVFKTADAVPAAVRNDAFMAVKSDVANTTRTIGFDKVEFALKNNISISFSDIALTAANDVTFTNGGGISLNNSSINAQNIAIGNNNVTIVADTGDSTIQGTLTGAGNATVNAIDDATNLTLKKFKPTTLNFNAANAAATFEDTDLDLSKIRQGVANHGILTAKGELKVSNPMKARVVLKEANFNSNKKVMSFDSNAIVDAEKITFQGDLDANGHVGRFDLDSFANFISDEIILKDAHINLNNLTMSLSGNGAADAEVKFEGNVKLETDIGALAGNISITDTTINATALNKLSFLIHDNNANAQNKTAYTLFSSDADIDPAISQQIFVALGAETKNNKTTFKNLKSDSGNHEWSLYVDADNPDDTKFQIVRNDVIVDPGIDPGDAEALEALRRAREGSAGDKAHENIVRAFKKGGSGAAKEAIRDISKSTIEGTNTQITQNQDLIQRSLTNRITSLTRVTAGASSAFAKATAPVIAPVVAPVIAPNASDASIGIGARASARSQINDSAASKAPVSRFTPATSKDANSAVSPAPSPSSRLKGPAESLAPAPSNAAPNTAPNTNTDIEVGYEDSILAGIAAGDAFNKYGAWISPIYSASKQKKNKQMDGYNSKSVGGTFGADNKISENSMVGFAGTYINTNIKHKDDKNQDKSKIRSYYATIYGYTQLTNRAFMQGSVSYGSNQVRVIDKRTFYTAVGLPDENVNFNSKFKVKTISADVATGFNKLVDNKYIMTPTIGLALSKTEKLNYSEVSEDTKKLPSSSIRQKALYNLDAYVGLGLTALTKEYNNGVFATPEVHASLKRNLIATANRTQVDIDGLKVNDGTKAKTHKFFYNVGAGINMSQGDVDYGMSYDADFAKKYLAHRGSLKIRVNF